MSAGEPLLDAVVRDARVLALVRNNGELETGGEEVEGSEDPTGGETAGASEWEESDRDPMGIVRLLGDLSAVCSGESLLVNRYSSSGGTTSAGGIGSPRAAAIN